MEPVELPDRLLVPGLVNAHSHLQLTSIGAQPYRGSFPDWVMMVRQRWTECVAAEDGDEVEAEVRAMAAGVEASMDAGVFRAGDIASTPVRPLGEFRRSRLRGVTYLELIGIGAEHVESTRVLLDAKDSTPVWSEGVGFGLQPHAPYSTGPAVYELATDRALQRRMPLATHLAETPDEHRFVQRADGPFRDLLRQLGKWDDAFAEHYRGHRSSVQWMARHLRRTNWLCAHCNYVDDDDIALLAETGASVAYCPRSSEYFGHCDHRYRDMREAGVNVCLGTDSIVCHGTLSILDEMRRLHQRDQTDPAMLLEMATVNGMRGLQLEPRDATLGRGAAAGLIAVEYDPGDSRDALRQVLAAARPPKVEVLRRPPFD